MVGELYLAKIYFTDESNFKIRPIRLCHEYRDEDFLYLPLTTNLSLSGIQLHSSDLSIGKLAHTSILLIPKIGTIHKSLLMKPRGLVKADVFQGIKTEICTALAVTENSTFH